jgi:arylsulfatase A-like enzyme
VYDTYVPIIFAGWNISARKINRHVETVDIAPTLALLLGTKLPSGSVGKPLEEVFNIYAPDAKK